MNDAQRPTRVVVVDADNPFNEVHGEFFWREDHERLLAAARESAYREGYDHGLAVGLSKLREVRFTRSRRPRHVFLRALTMVVAVAFLASLVSNLVH